MKSLSSTAPSAPADQVDAAVTRWAAAAGVPATVADGYQEQASFGRRVLRGFLLGLAILLPLMALGWAAQGDLIRLVLVCGVLVLGFRIVQQRRGSAR